LVLGDKKAEGVLHAETGNTDASARLSRWSHKISRRKRAGTNHRDLRNAQLSQKNQKNLTYWEIDPSKKGKNLGKTKDEKKGGTD